MLEDLEKVAWQKLTHAYGEAVDLPESLRGLASDDVYVRAKALYTLYDDLWHQGTISEASAAAIPFLIELLAAASTQDKDSILVLLSHLVANSPANISRSEVSTEVESTPGTLPEKRVQDLVWIEQAHDAVRQGIDVYLAQCADPDPKVRMCAAYILACLPECAAEITPRLHALLVQEQDRRVRASILLSLEALAERNAESLQLFKQMLKAKEELLVRLVAAMALTRLAREKTPARAVRVLVDALAKPELLADQYDELPWANGSVIGDISMTLLHLQPGMAQFAIPALVDSLATVGIYSALSVSRTLLYLAFNDKSLKEEGASQELTSEQRVVLTAITNSISAWNANSALRSVVESAGLAGLRDRLVG